MKRKDAYQDALERICSRGMYGSRLGLERIRAILSELGNPEKSYRCALVAGSNGKGSATEMMGEILRANGARVGTYFSPQVETFPERIRVDGKNAGRKEIAAAYFEVEKACRKAAPDATFFEVVTAMALLIFKKRKVGFAVIEVGLGGRLDATNAVEPEVSVITSIALEHTQQLGKTVEKIAREKCGIARKGKPLVCGFLQSKAEGALQKECARIGAEPLFAEEELRISDIEEKNGAYSFKAIFRQDAYFVSLASAGRFQISNACAALCACAVLGAKTGAVERGLARARPKYRFQKISDSPRTIADCAHNPEAAAALSAEVAKIPNRTVLLFSAMKDKDYASVLWALASKFDDIVVTEVRLARAEKLGRIAAVAKKTGYGVVAIKDSKRALKVARELAGKDGVLVIAGSIYLLSELFGKDKVVLGQ